jgi:maleamate amidohydrolase
VATNDDKSDAWKAETVGQMLAGLTEKRSQCSRVGPGRSAAVVVIDMQYFFLRDEPACEAALAANRRLLDHARGLSIPVFLIRNVFDRAEEINPFWMAKRQGRPFIMRDDPTSELHAGLGHAPSDIVVDKKHASGFTGTTLHDHLAARGVDTLLLGGAYTSACVRATAIDGAARHYRTMVVEACAYDTKPLAGPFALYEIADLYADVITFEEALGVLNRQAQGGS